MGNQLYDAVFRITECAVELDICVAIENPTNSHYWNVESTTKIRTNFGGNFVTFHACAHGGTRDKSTSIWQSQSYFDSLELRCDKKHSHASWRPVVKDGKLQFPTSEEAAYPHLLCERIVACVMTQVLKLGAVSIQTFQQHNSRHRKGALQWGRCHVARKSNLWCQNFKGNETMHCDPQQQPKQIDAKLDKLPKGSRVTHRP